MVLVSTKDKRKLYEYLLQEGVFACRKVINIPSLFTFLITELLYLFDYLYVIMIFFKYFLFMTLILAIYFLFHSL